MRDALKKLLNVVTHFFDEARLSYQLRSFVKKHRSGDEPLLVTLHRIDDVLFGIETFQGLKSSLAQIAVDRTELSPQEQKEIAADGSIVCHSRAFQRAASDIIRDTGIYYINRSESDLQRMFFRGQISGVEMMRESMQRLDVEHQENVRRSQESNDNSEYKFDVI